MYTMHAQSHSFTIYNPDVAVLSFRVMDEDVGRSEFVAFQALPVSCVRPGIRVVQLCDAQGKRLEDFAYAKLLVQVGVELL